MQCIMPSDVVSELVRVFGGDGAAGFALAKRRVIGARLTKIGEVLLGGENVEN